MKKKINEIIYREDLYPRFKPDQQKIQEYSENIELLPPILINQDNILIDGYHRYKAHKQLELLEIECEIEHTESENQLYLRAIETNSTHGLQLNQKDKQSIAVKVYDGKNKERLMKALSVSERSIRNWLEHKDKQFKQEREEKILELYLKCHTQQEIADLVGVSQQTVTNIIESFTKNGKVAEIGKNFKPFLYNIWNLNKEDNKTKHFGLFPEIFMENLLYYWTKPFDIVYDPFCGGGTTIDVCQKWLRRYYVSDRKPIGAREDEIKKWDIKDGLPEDLKGKVPDFVFLDPPYWTQAENKYSSDKENLGNMNLLDFYNSMEQLIKELKSKLNIGSKVAFVISASQWKVENKKYEDHTYNLMKLFEKYKFKELMRYMLPYSSEAYNGTQVEIAKKDKICINLIRDLVIFEK